MVIKKKNSIDSSQKQLKPGLIARGHKGKAVQDLQRVLNAWGYKIEIDGLFGATTQAAVRHFQSSQRLKVDGIVGPATRRSLASAINRKLGASFDEDDWLVELKKEPAYVVYRYIYDYDVEDDDDEDSDNLDESDDEDDDSEDDEDLDDEDDDSEDDEDLDDEDDDSEDDEEDDEALNDEDEDDEDDDDLNDEDEDDELIVRVPARASSASTSTTSRGT